MTTDRINVPMLPGLIRPGATYTVVTSATGILQELQLFLAGADSSTETVVARAGRDLDTVGQYVEVTIPAGDLEARATGSVQFAGENLLFRVQAHAGDALNLSGWVALAGAAPGTTPTLTTLERVKRYGNIGDTQDVLLQELIDAYSVAVAEYIGRGIVQASYVEKLDGTWVADGLVLTQWPVISVTDLKDYGVTMDPATYELEADKGILYAVRDGKPSSWGSGTRRYEATYDAGWADIPADLVNATTEQVVFAFKQTNSDEPQAQNRLGNTSKVLREGSDQTYMIYEWLPSVRMVLDRYKRMDP